jgi:hypothetical protein
MGDCGRTWIYRYQRRPFPWEPGLRSLAVHARFKTVTRELMGFGQQAFR